MLAFKDIEKKEQKLSNYAFLELKKLSFINLYSNEHSKNVFSFNVEDVDSSFVANFLNEQGICVRSGLHCAPLIHKKLKTFPVGAVRVSLDFFNCYEDINALIFALKKLNLLKNKAKN